MSNKRKLCSTEWKNAKYKSHPLQYIWSAGWLKTTTQQGFGLHLASSHGSPHTMSGVRGPVGWCTSMVGGGSDPRRLTCAVTKQSVTWHGGLVSVTETVPGPGADCWPLSRSVFTSKMLGHVHALIPKNAWPEGGLWQLVKKHSYGSFSVIVTKPWRLLACLQVWSKTEIIWWFWIIPNQLANLRIELKFRLKLRIRLKFIY